jgi:hypothetical protein
MRLEDIWEDIIDGESEIVAKDINNIAHAVIENEKNKVDKVKGKDLSSNDYTNEDKEKLKNLQNYDDTCVYEEIKKVEENSKTIFANALKGEKSGVSITMSDISPLEHELDISLSSDTITDFSNITLTKRGRNLVPILPDYETTYNGITYTIKNNRIKIVGKATGSLVFKLTNGYENNWTTANWRNEILLPAGTYTLSMQNKSGTGDQIYYPTFRTLTASGANHTVSWNNISNRFVTFTTEEPIACLFISIADGCVIDCEFDIQIENGNVMNPYEAPREVESFVATKDGKVNGVISLYPTTILETDNSNVTINCKYNRDINKAFAELQAMILEG